MKYSVLILLLFSINALSQVKTGTGGALDVPEYVPIINEDPFGETSLNKQEAKLLLFTKLLDIQERNCRSKGQNYLSLTDRDFMQAYLKLSIVKTSFKADDQCQDINAYFKCLYSDDVKEKLHSILQDKDMNKYLQKKYKINKQQAVKMLEFFKSIDKGCTGSDCKM